MQGSGGQPVCQVLQLGAEDGRTGEESRSAAAELERGTSGVNHVGIVRMDANNHVVGALSFAEIWGVEKLRPIHSAICALEDSQAATGVDIFGLCRSDGERVTIREIAQLAPGLALIHCFENAAIPTPNSNIQAGGIVWVERDVI